MDMSAQHVGMPHMTKGMQHTASHRMKNVFLDVEDAGEIRNHEQKPSMTRNE